MKDFVSLVVLFLIIGCSLATLEIIQDASHKGSLHLIVFAVDIFFISETTNFEWRKNIKLQE